MPVLSRFMPACPGILTSLLCDESSSVVYVLWNGLTDTKTLVYTHRKNSYRREEIPPIAAQKTSLHDVNVLIPEQALFCGELEEISATKPVASSSILYCEGQI
ncbi:hypothetical protein ANN_26827 [Periplaneta americana]|uniref:Uncharacterized protein n=1 Tax=Periplaneta americana TaxID=6978 RepID=A0ABQ8RZ94_PERAM|nr:hypothetical protein ANN_26827 [Periplaneta americana]